ncbi:hypothetical protein GH714_014052 [Hevea brasiliensis]|uniref:DOG1 domain-containing protein n=1 Tax=Hevea brasiliensis TaxID=3981 RepID=A0A6A6LNW7_HEVBR|nr:hypothetical protein GH714_014052 [Hevea brasiliensis]
MERQQVIVADKKMAELVRLVVRVKNGEEVRQVEGLVQVALKGVMAGLEKVMKAVDCLRLRTLKGVLDFEPTTMCGVLDWDWHASNPAKTMGKEKDNLAYEVKLIVFERLEGWVNQKRRRRGEMKRQQSSCSRQEDGGVGKVGGSSEEWGGSEAGEGLVQVALKGVMVGLERVMKAADCVRLRTLKGVLDVLSPLQCVEFLAGIGMYQILLRQWGKKRVCTIN